MSDTKVKDETRIYTTHGRKKNQGKLALVNGQIVLAYTEGSGPKEQIMGYTTLQELMQAATQPLPQYQLEF